MSAIRINFRSTYMSFVTPFRRGFHFFDLDYDTRAAFVNFVKKIIKGNTCYCDGKVVSEEEKSRVLKEKFDDRNCSMVYSWTMNLAFHSREYLLKMDIIHGGICGLMVIMEKELRGEIMVRKMCEEYLVSDVVDIILEHVKDNTENH